MMTNELFTPVTPSGIKLGDKVRSTRPEKEDAVGRVCVIAELATGAWHLWIAKNGKESISELNAAKCALVESTDSPEQCIVTPFKIKQMVVHNLSGFEGQIRHIEYHDSGCVRFHVVTGHVTDLGAFFTFTCDPDEIRPLEVPVAAEVKEPATDPNRAKEPVTVSNKAKAPSPVEFSRDKTELA